MNGRLAFLLAILVLVAACTSVADPRTPEPPRNGMGLHPPSEDVERAVARFASGGRVEITGVLTIDDEQAVLFSVEGERVGWLGILDDTNGRPELVDATELPLPSPEDRFGGYSSYVQIPTPAEARREGVEPPTF